MFIGAGAGWMVFIFTIDRFWESVREEWQDLPEEDRERRQVRHSTMSNVNSEQKRGDRLSLMDRPNGDAVVPVAVHRTERTGYTLRPLDAPGALVQHPQTAQCWLNGR